MSGGRSTSFGLPDNANGGRAGAADQSDLLKALKLQAMYKGYLSGQKTTQTSIHQHSVISRIQYRPNQQAIQRSIFYRPV
jgi:hypothetical protein